MARTFFRPGLDRGRPGLLLRLALSLRKLLGRVLSVPGNNLFLLAGFLVRAGKRIRRNVRDAREKPTTSLDVLVGSAFVLLVVCHDFTSVDESLPITEESMAH